MRCAECKYCEAHQGNGRWWRWYCLHPTLAPEDREKRGFFPGYDSGDACPYFDKQTEDELTAQAR